MEALTRLVLRRREGEAVLIDGVRVLVNSVRQSQVALVIEAPRSVDIIREEVLAAQSAADFYDRARSGFFLGWRNPETGHWLIGVDPVTRLDLPLYGVLGEAAAEVQKRGPEWAVLYVTDGEIAYAYKKLKPRAVR